MYMFCLKYFLNQNSYYYLQLYIYQYRTQHQQDWTDEMFVFCHFNICTIFPTIFAQFFLRYASEDLGNYPTCIYNQQNAPIIKYSFKLRIIVKKNNIQYISYFTDHQLLTQFVCKQARTQHTHTHTTHTHTHKTTTVVQMNVSKKPDKAQKLKFITGVSSIST